MITLTLINKHRRLLTEAELVIAKERLLGFSWRDISKKAGVSHEQCRLTFFSVQDKLRGLAK